MKAFTILLISFIFPPLYALSVSQVDTCVNSRALFETLSRIRKQNDFLNINLNTRIAFHTALSSATTEQSVFRLDYLRLQVTGQITDRISYKWLQHLNRSNTPRSLDNFPSSIDCLGVGFQITPTLSSFVGKQYADYGGFEYDANPAEVYEYSDMGEYITCFLVGANLSWWFTPTQEMRLQILNARPETTLETYGQTPATFRPAKTPLGYTLNWNGNFSHHRLQTRCSFSLFHEGQQDNVYFLALAAAWIQENLNFYIDGMYSAEKIDKLGILSELTAQSGDTLRAQHAGYFSLVSRINYRILPQLNLFVKGMYETTSVRKTFSEYATGRYRTSYGYQGGIEYFPMKDNLRFFLMYRARRINYTNQAKSLGLDKVQMQHLSLGLIYNIPLF